MSIPINTAVFRDYDIRGVYPTEINEDIYYVIGRSLADYLKVEKIAVGFDGRLSSPSLFKAFTEGITESGTDVVDLGLISTEMHYFASGFYHFPANAIISASHNPGEYNGLKIVKAGVIPLHGGYGLPDIKELSLQQKFHAANRKGMITRKNIMDEWIRHVMTFVDMEKLKPLKVVVDAGNGMGGISWEKLIGKLPIKIIPMYFEPDGNFPHHLADPLKAENLKDLQAAIKRYHADIGIALDGDADRMFVVDESGNSVSGTVTTAILARALLETYGPSPVLYNAVCGRIVPETIKNSAGEPHRVRVGHSYIKEKMKKLNALFAGEHSGHFYFRDNYYAESSIIAGLIFIQYLSSQDKPLSGVVKQYDIYPTSGEISFKVRDANAVTERIEKKYRDALSMDHLDGLSVWYKDWWFNLRASKTEPLLRLNIEADNKPVLENRMQPLVALLHDESNRYQDEQ